ncbi:uncharacterized protein G2W53_004687 [Senna tora]|uniref:Uncharacterized protein n=1 Tax=Senna tora TaxID=362788 RepID=A0A834XDL5_9FABA|nr:uncharacterized protein G2W53_004687 [Senna tora]
MKSFILPWHLVMSFDVSCASVNVCRVMKFEDLKELGSESAVKLYDVRSIEEPP